VQNIRVVGSGKLLHGCDGLQSRKFLAGQRDMQPNAFLNSALIQDESLLNLVLVLEQGWPAGPCFLHALNTLVETIVLYEHVYFDPLHYLDRVDLNPMSITSQIRSSSMVQLLLGEGAIEQLPNDDDLDQRLEATGREYKVTDFLLDALWTPHSFLYGTPEDEANRLEVYLDVTTKGGQCTFVARSNILEST
jgi:hypothetical protein